MTAHPVKLCKIVVTGNKGGTGKTTISALLAEYLIYQGRRVQLIDTDPNQVLQSWINNCQEEGRVISSALPVDYQIIDTAGVSGGSAVYVNQANIVLIPFVPHYVDLQVIIPWFDSLSKSDQQKVVFLPNRYQKTKEQQEGLKELNEVWQDASTSWHDRTIGTVGILPSLGNRPALFGSLLNGSKDNFFTKKEAEPLKKIFRQVLSYAKN